MTRSFRDRDYIETQDGLIFCVIGNVHPPGRVISYLKYVPSRDMQYWRRGDLYYERKMRYYSAGMYVNVREFLREHYPEYVVYDPVHNIELIEVPVSHVKVHYKPEVRVREIVEDPRDFLEQQVRDLVLDFTSYADIDIIFLGITGSILLRIHNVTMSDIDLIVYSRQNVDKTLQAVNRMIQDGVLQLPDWFVKQCVGELSKVHKMLSSDTLYRIVLRKKHRLIYRDRVISINFVKLEVETDERYGEKVYIQERPVTLRATIVENSESYFLPGRYIIDNVKGIDCDVPNDVQEVVTYEGLYSGLCNVGEEVIVRGMLERVIDVRTGETYHRVVIGSEKLRGQDYIVPVTLLK